MHKKLYFIAAAAGLALAAPAHAGNMGPDEFAAWLDRAVERNMVFPAALERSNASGIATVGFRVAADGRPVDVEIVRSSGNSTIDRAATRTIARLDLPAGAPRGPHVAVLQYGTAVTAEDDEQYAAELNAESRQAWLALRDSARQLHARAGAAPDSVSTFD
jgi:TonB family protein